MRRSSTGASGIALANAARSLGRSAWPETVRDRVAASFALASGVGFVALEVWGLSAFLGTAETALLQLPGVAPVALAGHLLRGALAAAAALLLLGTLTTAVSSLFLTEELPALMSLPISHGRLFGALLLRSVALSAAPTWLLALPAVAVVSTRAPRPLLAASSLVLALLATTIAAGSLGVAGALLLVRLVPPRRARLLAATVSALGLAAALVGARQARPERLLDPLEAVEVLESLSRSPAPPAGGNPLFRLADAALLGVTGAAAGLAATAGAVVAATASAALLSRILAPVHLEAYRRSRETPEPTEGTRRRARSRGLALELPLAEARTLLRDASTPAQLGSLAAVFLLDILNLRLLPTADPAARDLVAGFQTSLGLFLVSALSLRFAYPAVSSDGRAALLLRAFPLSPARHLLVRWAVRALPATLLAVLLAFVTSAHLGLDRARFAVSLGLAVSGGLALPALHVGLGALFPRYDAPNPVSVALGPGGLFALALSTGLSLAAAPVVSSELRGLLAALAGHGSPSTVPGLAIWTVLAAVFAGAALSAGAASVERADVHAG